MSISVVLPSYKEVENLKILLPILNDVFKKIAVESEVLVIDTMQPMDATSDVCSEFGAKHILREGGNNYGDAIRTGINKAAFEYIVIMDCDCSHDPHEIEKFYGLSLAGTDIVIGSRYTKNGKTDNNIILQAMSFMVNSAYRVMFGIKVKDVSNSFRMYRASFLKTISFECDNFDIVEEILIKMVLKYKNIKIVEHPIFFKKRMYGESKRDLFKFVLSYFVTMKRLLKIKMQFKSK